MANENVIIFHHDDCDGIMSAWLVKQKYDLSLTNPNVGSNVTCIKCSYDNKFNLDLFKEMTLNSLKKDQVNLIYMVDYSIKQENAMQSYEVWLKSLSIEYSIDFIWIDHHITTIKNIEKGFSSFAIKGLRDINFAGCGNVWKYFYNDKEMPEYVALVNYYDIWDHNSKFNWDDIISPFISYLISFDFDSLNDNNGELVKELKRLSEYANNNYLIKCISYGKQILSYSKQQWKKSANFIYEREWNGYKCLVLNSSNRGSQHFDYYPNVDNYDIMVIWSYNNGAYYYSLYTKKDSIHVGELCQKYLNGGGHKGAAGGNSKELQFA